MGKLKLLFGLLVFEPVWGLAQSSTENYVKTTTMLDANSNYVYSASGQKLRAVHYTAKPNITRTWGEKPAELTMAQILQADSTDYLLGGSLTMKNGRIDKYLFDGGYAQASVAINIIKTADSIEEISRLVL